MPKESKSTQRAIRFTPSQLAALQRAADATGETFSRFVVVAAIERADRLGTIVPDDLQRPGNPSHRVVVVQADGSWAEAPAPPRPYFACVAHEYLRVAVFFLAPQSEEMMRAQAHDIALRLFDEADHANN